MTESATELAAIAHRWAPAAVHTTGATSAWSVAAFSALLDLEPVAGPGEPLPPLWHWFGFLDHARQDALGHDGHPVDGPFMPPIPDRRRMLAGGRLTVHEPMRVDETLLRRSSLTRCETKSGRSGEMLLVTVQHEYVRDGRTVVVEDQDIVYRSQPAGQARGTAPTPQADAAAEAPPGALVVVPDEIMLFRFSALTHNTHRIHYDQPYAVGVEGYPGLVVHGPLLALLLLEIPRRHHRTDAVTHFEFRLRRPAFASHPVAVRIRDGEGDPSSLDLEAGVPGLESSITGTATMHGPHSSRVEPGGTR